MITNDEKKHYLTVKGLLVLCRGKTSKSNRDFYCLNCLYSFKTENKLKNHGFCYIEMLKK